MTKVEDELRDLAGRLLVLAEARYLPNYVNEERPNIGRSDSELAQVAKREIEKRNLRSKYLPQELFAEGGWNILLDLFVTEEERRVISVTSACIGAGVPATTALRSMTVLIEMGLVGRSKSQEDKRVTYLHLTTLGRDSMRAVLDAIG